MSVRMHATPPLSALVAAVPPAQDLVARCATIALMQARIVAEELRGAAIRALSPSERAVAASLAKRIERRAIFDEQFLTDLEAFLAAVDTRIQAGSHVGWQADENHNRGGYETVSFDQDAVGLLAVSRELDLLREATVATLSASWALREVAALTGG